MEIYEEDERGRDMIDYKNDEAKRYVSKVLVARNAQRRIKDKAFALKEKLQGKAE